MYCYLLKYIIKRLNIYEIKNPYNSHTLFIESLIIYIYIKNMIYINQNDKKRYTMTLKITMKSDRYQYNVTLLLHLILSLILTYILTKIHNLIATHI